MKAIGIPLRSVRLTKSGKIEPVIKHRSVSDKIARKKRPKKTWRAAK